MPPDMCNFIILVHTMNDWKYNINLVIKLIKTSKERYNRLTWFDTFLKIYLVPDESIFGNEHNTNKF